MGKSVGKPRHVAAWLADVPGPTMGKSVGKPRRVDKS